MACDNSRLVDFDYAKIQIHNFIDRWDEGSTFIRKIHAG